MYNNELTNLLSVVLIPIGFKKIRNNLVKDCDEITKVVNLQKSNFANSFYINYGCIINSIPLDDLYMHIYNRVTSLDSEERNKITELLDLDSNLLEEERSKELKGILLNK